jgi:hypothetical protein
MAALKQELVFACWQLTAAPNTGMGILLRIPELQYTSALR